MSSEQDWMESSGRRWDFSSAASAAPAETPSADDYDVGYEAALPGLQSLLADAAEARRPTASPGDI
ncbi:hypothetical protein V4F39_13905 [Aquincola sp. MAHUQ-54]|uniref:Uncharacterized protein n=1 Tax=Aquincola agrisoli TaxID=3119538 RepID=A0AAW9Q5D4_9BURK